MIKSFIHIGDDLDRKYQVKKFGGPVCLNGRFDSRGQFQCSGTASDFHISIAETFHHVGEKIARNAFMNEQGFHGIANPRPLNLGIKAYFPGHFKVSVLIHVYVTDTLVMFQYRDTGMPCHKTDKALATSRNNCVYVVIKADQNLNCLSICGWNNLYGLWRESAFHQCLF